MDEFIWLIRREGRSRDETDSFKRVAARAYTHVGADVIQQQMPTDSQRDRLHTVFASHAQISLQMHAKQTEERQRFICLYIN